MRHLIWAWLLCSGVVTAADPARLAAQKSCLACHTVKAKVVGPAYVDVAKRYKGQKDAAKILATRIRSGGSGNWGTMAMPPQAVTEQEATLLAQWILRQ